MLAEFVNGFYFSPLPAAVVSSAPVKVVQPATTSTLPIPKLTKPEDETTSNTIVKAAAIVPAIPRVSSESVLSAAATPQVRIDTFAVQQKPA